MAKQDQPHLCNTRTQVRALAWQGGLKDPALPQLWHRSQLQLGIFSWRRNTTGNGEEKKEEGGREGREKSDPWMRIIEVDR